MHKSDGAQLMEEDAGEPAPAAEPDWEPGEQPAPKKQKVSGRTDPSASQVLPAMYLCQTVSASVLWQQVLPYCAHNPDALWKLWILSKKDCAGAPAVGSYHTEDTAAEDDSPAVAHSPAAGYGSKRNKG